MAEVCSVDSGGSLYWPEARQRSEAAKLGAFLTELGDERPTDHLVRTRALALYVTEGQLVLRLPASPQAAAESVVVTPHALAQLCELATVALPGGRDPRPGALEAFARCLEERLRALDCDMLARCWRDELRGFLPDGYPRRSPQRLNAAFVDACRAHGARAIGALRSATRSVLYAVRPQLFDLGGGERVAMGVSWEHSEYGDGPLRVSAICARPDNGAVLILRPVASEVLRASAGRYCRAQYEIDLRDSAARLTQGVREALVGGQQLLGRLREDTADRQGGAALAQAGAALEPSEREVLEALCDRELARSPATERCTPGGGTRWAVACAISWLAGGEPVSRALALQTQAGALVMRGGARSKQPWLI